MQTLEARWRRHSTGTRYGWVLATALSITVPFGQKALYAQVLTGEIDGAVHDSTGAIVPNATVTITNSREHLVQRVIKTGEQGQFTAPLPSVGTYSLSISSPGFKSFAVSDIEVHVGSPVTIPVTLSVGELAETVSVSADQITTQLESAAAATLIDAQQVTGLSLSSRNYLQLMYIQPGISSGASGPNDRGNITSSGQVNAQTFSVNGSGTASNGYFVDGADTLKRAGQQPVAFPGVDFIQESTSSVRTMAPSTAEQARPLSACRLSRAAPTFTEARSASFAARSSMRILTSTTWRTCRAEASGMPTSATTSVVRCGFRD